MADIDFGQLSEALNDKSDRDLRNVDTTAKADAVIDFQVPTAENNYTWYRKYKSGWVEQGGITDYMAWNGNGATKTETLPVPMADANYVATATMLDSTSYWNYPGCGVRSRTTTQIAVGIATLGNGQGNSRCSWEVKGMAAN